MATKKSDTKALMFMALPRNTLEKAGWINYDGKDYVFELGKYINCLQGDGFKVEIDKRPDLVEALISSEYGKTIQFTADGNYVSNAEARDIVHANVGEVKVEL